jgi:hypothetical protein
MLSLWLINVSTTPGRLWKSGGVAPPFMTAAQNSGNAQFSACYNCNKLIYFINVATSFLDEIDYHGGDKERGFSYIFDPRWHTPEINHCLVYVAGVGKSMVAAPTLWHQSNTLILGKRPFWAFSPIQEVLPIGKQLRFGRHSCEKVKKKVKFSPLQALEALRVVRGWGSHIF